MVVRECCRVDLKRSLIFPIGKADPLQAELVVPIEGIGDQAAVQQVGLNYAGNLRGMPFLHVRSIRVCDGPKPPARIQVSGRRLGCLAWSYRAQTDQQQPKNVY